MTVTYTDRWRSKVRNGAQRSAKALVPLLVARFNPSTVVDVGCGEGWFRDVFRGAGCDTTGVDGGWVTGPDVVADLSMGFPNLGRFDLAVSLEVAEHLPKQRAKAFVEWLCSLAPVVVFSAAVPGQGGTGHVNERPPTYWRDLFTRHGYVTSGALRWQVWNDDRIAPWYRQNVLVAADHPAKLDDLPIDGCPYVIHPDIWRLYRPK